MPDDLVTRLSKRLKERPWYEKLFAMGDLFEIRKELRANSQLRPALSGIQNAFHPWKKTTAPPE